jgi:hypothetical protein
MENPLSSATGSATPPARASRSGFMARAASLFSGNGDRLAIGLSGLCIIHCIASALFLASLASVGTALLNPAFHEIGLGLAILLGLALLITGALRHGQILPLLIGGGGLVTMAFALTLPHDSREVIATLIGVSILALGHEMNRRAGNRAS